MGCWQGRDILTLMVRMKKLAVVEKRLPVATLLNTCGKYCPILKEANKGMTGEVVLYRWDEIPLLVDAFVSNGKDAASLP